jgi:hypothetical protein
MGWIDKNGKRLSKTDCDGIKSMYEGVFQGLLEVMKFRRHYMKRGSWADYDELTAQIQNHANEMLQKFEEKTNDKKLICVDSFFNKSLLGLTKIVESKKEKFDERDFRRIRDSLESIYERLGIKGFKPKKKDTAKGLNESMKSFKLTKKAFKGIKDIRDYAANGRDFAPLTELRKENSGTFSAAANDENLEKKYQDALNCSYEVANAFKQKEKVSFGDLYDAFSRFNSHVAQEGQFVHPGKMSGTEMQAGMLDGISPMSMPVQMYYFLDNVAEKINSIKKVQNKELQKSQAVQLAAFTNQMAVAAHVFGDGNGRTCRLLADTILQTFDMPPHTPNPAMMGLANTIGNAMDYDKCTAIMLRGVRVSNDYLELNKGNTREGIADEAKRIFSEEKINPEIVDENDTKNSVELAIKVRENKSALLDACHDLVMANHLGSKNSDEYKTLAEQSKALEELLKTKPMYSEDVLRQMKTIRKATDNYLRHTKEIVKTGSTRRMRFNAARRISMISDRFEKQLKTIQKKLSHAEAAGNAPAPQKKTGRSL